MSEALIKGLVAEILFGKAITESVVDREIVNFLYEELMLEKLLYGEPVSIEELRKLLRNKIVNFEFIKLDGEVRPARGTTIMKYIPTKDHPKGVRPSSDKVATFYDLDKDAWRSVSKRSKEVVLKKDKEGKPKVVVQDKETKEIKQGEFYNYTTNKGVKTYVKILRKMDDGNYQVTSPIYKTTFTLEPRNIGDEITEKDVERKFKKQMNLNISDYYKYKTKKGEETHVKIVDKLDDGFIKVKSPVATSTFAISPDKLGDKLSEDDIQKIKEPKEKKEEPKKEEPEQSPEPGEETTDVEGEENEEE